MTEWVDTNTENTARATLAEVLDPTQDSDQCSGCDATYEWDNTRSYCPYHQGQMSGYDRAMGEIAEAAGAFQRDPELVDMVVDRAEQMRARDYELAQQSVASQPEPEGLSEHEKEALHGINEAANPDEDEPVDPTAVRLAVDADCPACRYPERRFDPNTEVFSCRKCPYTSHSRDR